MLIKLATFFEHKEKLIEILYYFTPDTPENRLEIIIESRANNDQIYGSGIKNSDELICLIETIPTINENIINAPPDGRLIFFQDTIEKYYVTRNEIQEAITNEINEYLN